MGALACYKNLLDRDVAYFVEALETALRDMATPGPEWHYPLWCEACNALSACEWSVNKVLAEKANVRAVLARNAPWVKLGGV